LELAGWQDKGDERLKKFRLEAVIDDNEAGLYLMYGDEVYEELEWPKDWPKFMTCEQLASVGFEVIEA